MAASASEQLIESLQAIVGPAGYREGADIESKNYQDAMGARSTELNRAGVRDP